jgi:hypothetical protein
MTGRFRRAVERRLRELAGVDELEQRVGERLETAQRERDAARAEATQRADELARRIAALETLARIPVVMDPGGDEPEIVFRPFDRGQPAAENPADVSAVAHRAGLEEARFDEDLAMYGDWELLARLTRDRDPFTVPAIACFYGTAAGSRLSAAPIDSAERTAVIRAAMGSNAVNE